MPGTWYSAARGHVREQFSVLPILDDGETGLGGRLWPAHHHFLKCDLFISSLPDSPSRSHTLTLSPTLPSAGLDYQITTRVGHTARLPNVGWEQFGLFGVMGAMDAAVPWQMGKWASGHGK